MFEITKTFRFQYKVDAPDAETALKINVPSDATATVIRQRARDLDKQPGVGRPALKDRELRPGRKLVARYKKVEWIAEVQADRQIALRKKGGSHADTFTTLARAAMHIVDGKAVNAWALFRDAPAAKEKPAASPPKPEADAAENES